MRSSQELRAHISLRRLQPEEAPRYKTLRLEALKNDPGMFGNRYELEAAYSEERWTERLVNPNGACFGLFYHEELIGITGIIIDKEEPAEAHLTQSYIRDNYRGRQLSRLFYEARIAWAKQHNLSRLIISHRESNVISKAANQHFGFRYTHRETKLWPDGQQEDVLYYVLEL